MSKNTVRQLVETRFLAFDGLDNARKYYANTKEIAAHGQGFWAAIRVEFVSRKVVSINQNPCTRRYGTIVIDVYGHLGQGTAGISELTDALEAWFDFYQADDLWCGASHTVDAGRAQTHFTGRAQTHFISTVYVPFEYDEHN
ncbi:hypothetical protein B0181_10550 [Moraxella caviae]|uniref:Uncharacterized protein n=1 Tax=Moraxella caviae TaxID=34060 RepID=A0A1S9ZWH1_9GAMM|nr:hypothetical protein [Moraxella caviae]OOR87281.1 hypothetical protein B0181_10550 [Moraxella caviae]STZ14053.1 Uncharacterised protein [Moraxella caviae]